MPTLVGKMLDHYHMRDQIGKGGMATVYRAVDTRTVREVAIKVLSPTMSVDRRFLKRFRREAQLVKQHLTHPNIVAVIDYGQVEGFIYLVMPYVEGETLQERLSRGGIADQESKIWIGQISDALGYAHDKGIIHRDIKPSNVIIDTKGRAMLTDFGLARHIEGSDTLTGSLLIGTPAYLSPEQGRGEKLDPRSDQYSLGVLLYQLATGRLPFEADKPMATVMAHIQEPVPRLWRFNRAIRPDLERVILKSLAKRREDRFPSIRVMNEAYQAALEDRPLPPFRLPPETSAQVRSALDLPMQPAAESPVWREHQPANHSRNWLLLVMLVAVAALVLILAFDPSLLGLARSNPKSDTPLAVATLAETPSVEALSQAAPPPNEALPITSDGCPGISLAFLGEEGNDVKWVLDNQSTLTINVQRLRGLTWDVDAKGQLKMVLLGGDVIWEGSIRVEDLAQGKELEMSTQLVRRVAANQPTLLTMNFQRGDPAIDPYAFTLDLDAGCSLGSTWQPD